MEAGVERGEHDLGVGPGGRADDESVDVAGVEERAVVGVQAGDAVARAERLADGRAGLRERRDREAVAKRREVREVLGLCDETAADDPDANRQASAPSTPLATFSNASAISSMSCSSFCGERSTWIVRASRSSVRGQSGAGCPASAIASSTGFQNG